MLFKILFSLREQRENFQFKIQHLAFRILMFFPGFFVAGFWDKISTFRDINKNIEIHSRNPLPTLVLFNGKYVKL